MKITRYNWYQSPFYWFLSDEPDLDKDEDDDSDDGKDDDFPEDTPEGAIELRNYYAN